MSLPDQKPLPLPEGVGGESIYSTVLDNRGSFWISAFRHGVFRQEGGAWVKVPVKPARPATGVLSFDPSGDVWVRYGGRSLFSLSGRRSRRPPTASSDPEEDGTGRGSVDHVVVVFVVAVFVMAGPTGAKPRAKSA